jgi:hypothetical protein
LGGEDPLFFPRCGKSEATSSSPEGTAMYCQFFDWSCADAWISMPVVEFLFSKLKRQYTNEETKGG